MRVYLFLAGMIALSGPSLALADELVEKGKYLYHLANCYSCHTDTENDGPALAGGRLLETEFGNFYSPNITPDKKTGIGNWSDEEFTRAVREGIAPDGSHYYPSFPYIAYRNISHEDVLAIKAYIFSLQPVQQANQAHQLDWYLLRPALTIWKMLAQQEQPAAASGNSRGAYLIDTLGHCNECHTPRNAIGILQMDQALTGNKDLSAPDISASALSDWSDEELEDLFIYGALPDGDYVSDHMAEVVEYSTAKWTPQDLAAAIAYLRSEK